jgi:hypothetical protein
MGGADDIFGCFERVDPALSVCDLLSEPPAPGPEPIPGAIGDARKKLSF